MKAELYFHGTPCVRCGGTLRYASWRRCVACEQKRQRKDRPGKDPHLSWLPPFLIDGVKVVLTPRERNLFAALYNARGAQVPIERVIELTWENPDLAPLNMQSSLSVAICTLRRALEPTRFRIVTDWWRGYRMVRIEESEMAA